MGHVIVFVSSWCLVYLIFFLSFGDTTTPRFLLLSVASNVWIDDLSFELRCRSQLHEAEV